MRDWLHVDDHCRAVDLLIELGVNGEVYNVGGGNDIMNVELTHRILDGLGKPRTLIKPVADRPGHDRRYCLDTTKLRATGWAPQVPFAEGLQQTVEWYRDNEWWWRPIKEQDAAYKAVLPDAVRRPAVDAVAVQAGLTTGSHRGPVLVTGAAGFAGSHLAELLASTADLVCWSREEPAPGLVPSARWQQIDLLDREQVRAAVRDLRPAQVYHLAGVPHVGASWDATTPTLAGNVLATHYLFDALRRAGVAARVLVTASATVYAPSDQPIAEDGAIAPGSPYALSKLAQEMRSLRACRRGRARRDGRARLQPHRAAADAGVRRAELRAPDRVDGTRRAAARDSRRQPHTAARPLRRARRGPRLCRADGARRQRCDLQRRVGRRPPDSAILDALVARARVAVTVETDPSLLRPNDTAALVGDCSRLHRDTGWSPQIGFEQMLDDLLEYWRAQS